MNFEVILSIVSDLSCIVMKQCNSTRNADIILIFIKVYFYDGIKKPFTLIKSSCYCRWAGAELVSVK